MTRTTPVVAPTGQERNDRTSVMPASTDQVVFRGMPMPFITVKVDANGEPLDYSDDDQQVVFQTQSTNGYRGGTGQFAYGSDSDDDDKSEKQVETKTKKSEKPEKPANSGGGFLRIFKGKSKKKVAGTLAVHTAAAAPIHSQPVLIEPAKTTEVGNLVGIVTYHKDRAPAASVIDAARIQVGTLTTERNAARTQVGTLTTERNAAQAQVRTLTTERDAALRTVEARNQESSNLKRQYDTDNADFAKLAVLRSDSSRMPVNTTRVASVGFGLAVGAAGAGILADQAMKSGSLLETLKTPVGIIAAGLIFAAFAIILAGLGVAHCMKSEHDKVQNVFKTTSVQPVNNQPVNCK